MRHRSGARAALCLVAAALAGCGSAPAEPEAPSPFVGRWRTVGIEGKDADRNIHDMLMEFRKDRTFTSTGLVRLGDTAQPRERKGKYSLAGDMLCLAVTDTKKLLWVRFRFEGSELVLEDPGMDSRIRLARLKDE